MTDTVNDTFSEIWDHYLKPLKPRVHARALELARDDQLKYISNKPGQTELDVEITAANAFDAIREFIPGGRVGPTHYVIDPEPRQGWFNKNVDGFIGITGGLAIIFGILGLLPVIAQSFGGAGINAALASIKSTTEGFLEISKLCAGALVGGAAGAAAVASSNRKKPT